MSISSPELQQAFRQLHGAGRRQPRRSPSGELVALLGPSGSGKTTLLRIIAGLETRRRRHGALPRTRTSTHARPRERNVGFVFQHYALFRHMTRVRERRLRPARARRLAARTEITRARARAAASWSSSTGSSDRYPSQLSGGQRQRVALARALAVEPQVLLLDEPFGALDAKVRQELRQWLRRLHDEIHVTSVFVTHDQEEAFEVADRVVVMNEGRIEQVGTPDEVFEQPANAVRHELPRATSTSSTAGCRRAGAARTCTLDRVSGAPGRGGAAGGRLLPPHELEVSRTDEGGGLWATVSDVRMVGAIVKIEVMDAPNSGPDAGRARTRAVRKVRAIIGETVYIKPRRRARLHGQALTS